MSEQDSTGVPVDFGLIRRYVAAREDDLTRMASLQSATERMTTEIAALRTTLDTVATKDQITQLEETRLELARKDAEELVAKFDVVTTTARNRARNLFVASIVISLVTVGALFYYVRSSQDQRHSACETSNSEAITDNQRSVAFVRPQLQTELGEAHPDPAIVAILTALANAKPQLRHCV